MLLAVVLLPGSFCSARDGGGDNSPRSGVPSLIQHPASLSSVVPSSRTPCRAGIPLAPGRPLRSGWLFLEQLFPRGSAWWPGVGRAIRLV